MRAATSRYRPPARPLLALLAASLLAGALSARVGAETEQKGNVRVSFDAKLSPTSLPRRGLAPVAVSVGGTISTLDGAAPPPLRSLQIAINRNGRLQTRGLPVCRLEDIQPASNENALRACRSSLVGEGKFAASVAIPEQSPFPSVGKILAFNGLRHGRPVILAHIYGTEPIPTSFTLPIAIGPDKGTFGTILSAELPDVDSNIAYVTEVGLTLKRSFAYGGRRRGYIAAGCPAPDGFHGAVFPLLRASFSFEGAATISSTLIRSCHVRG